MVFKFIYDIFFDKPIFSMYNSLCDTFASLAQLDRVVHYECKGLGFESLMTHHIKRDLRTTTKNEPFGSRICPYLFRLNKF